MSFAGASALIPVLPLSAPALPVAVAPVNAAKANWAALYARAHGRATPELIQKWLHVGPDQARAVMSDLVARNVVAAPVAGSAAAVQPMYPSRAIPGAHMASERAKDAVTDYLRSALDHDDTYSEPQTGDDPSQ
ncbi:hypothetical protein N9O61_02910 [Octadecabacter sp.]|nr:hypothetical protein [Octadecabacter sp.]